MTFTIRVGFMDSFKIGDNINYNLGILKRLYEAYSLPGGNILIKPIVLINASITEALLFDFVVNRLKRPFKTEIISFTIFNELKEKNLKRFDHYVTQVEKYELFGKKDSGYYSEIRKLNKIRNRIHIQNEDWYKPHDEQYLFTDKVKIISEKVLEKLLKTMSSKYSRREEYHGYVCDFELPWKKHFE